MKRDAPTGGEGHGGGDRLSAGLSLREERKNQHRELKGAASTVGRNQVGPWELRTESISREWNQLL